MIRSFRTIKGTVVYYIFFQLLRHLEFSCEGTQLLRELTVVWKMHLSFCECHIHVRFFMKDEGD